MYTIMATENNNKNLNVPNLRFPEFSKPYTQTTISKLATIVGGGTPDTTVQEYWNGGIQWFTPSEIGKNKYIDKSERTITQDGLNNSSAKVLPINTILLSTRATIGESSIAKTECCTNQGFQSLIANEEITCYEYLYYLVATLKKELIRKSCGSTFLEISANEVRKIKTFIPSLEEQCKVASLLALLDERIATQIKIIEDLKKLKSAISNEIFEHTSNRKCELKEIASVIMGQSPSSHAYNHNAVGLPLIQGNLDIENGQLSPRIYTSEITQTCECGDVILTVRAPVGEIAIAQQEACIGRGVCSIRPHVKNDTNLIYQFLQYFRPKWGSLEQGSTFTAVSGTDIRGVAVSIPSTDKIKLLNVYDNKIRVESRILTNLIQQKQYLLAQMFI